MGGCLIRLLRVLALVIMVRMGALPTLFAVSTRTSLLRLRGLLHVGVKTEFFGYLKSLTRIKTEMLQLNGHLLVLELEIAFTS